MDMHAAFAVELAVITRAAGVIEDHLLLGADVVGFALAAAVAPSAST